MANKLAAVYKKLSKRVTVTKGLTGPQKGEYRLVVKGRNREILMTSEGYVDARDAEGVIRALVESLATTEIGRKTICEIGFWILK